MPQTPQTPQARRITDEEHTSQYVEDPYYEGAWHYGPNSTDRENSPSGVYDFIHFIESFNEEFIDNYEDEFADRFMQNNPAYSEPIVPIETKIEYIQYDSLMTSIDTCAICLDTHYMIDSVTTSCNHHFGKTCFNAWCSKQHYSITCPLCRTENPSLTEYRLP